MGVPGERGEIITNNFSAAKYTLNIKYSLYKTIIRIDCKTKKKHWKYFKQWIHNTQVLHYESKIKKEKPFASTAIMRILFGYSVTITFLDHDTNQMLYRHTLYTWNVIDLRILHFRVRFRKILKQTAKLLGLQFFWYIILGDYFFRVMKLRQSLNWKLVIKLLLIYLK